MADTILQLNDVTVAGGQKEDAWDLIGAGGATVVRQRNQIAGETLAEIARVKNNSPEITDYALVARTLPSTPLLSALSSGMINAALAGDNIVIGGAVLQTARVFRLFFIAGGATSFKFKSGATDLTPYMTLFAGGGVTLDFDQIPWFVTGAAEDFIINLSAPAQLSGRIYYQQS